VWCRKWSTGCEAHTPRSDNPVFKHASFTYGTGFQCSGATRTSTPTHECSNTICTRADDFFSADDRCVRAGQPGSVEDARAVGGFLAHRRERRAIRLFRSERTSAFSPRASKRTHDFFQKHARTTIRCTCPRYGHLDVFIGKDAARDVFPSCWKNWTDELKEERNGIPTRLEAQRGRFAWWTASRSIYR